MRRLYFFNPDNDVALAARQDLLFTPPAAALDLRRSGALLPMWWAGPDDEVLVETQEALDGADMLASRHGLKAAAVKKASPGIIASPWGWSATSARIMSDAGASGIPGAEALERIRLLSHRRSSIGLARAMGAPEHIVAMECFGAGEVMEAVDRLHGQAVVKQPWSSSGRGVIYTGSIDSSRLFQAAKGTIKRQGSMMVEPFLDRVADFAALFYSDGTEVRFEGVSVFATESNGDYAGNIVAPQNRLSDMIPVDISVAVDGAVRYLTMNVAPHYRGWMGVDMLAYRSGGELCLSPCVELNLRMTMGVVALLLNRAGMEGLLKVIRGVVPQGAVDLSPAGGGFSLILEPGRDYCGMRRNMV